MLDVPDRRSYDDPCGIARALDLVGERWALLVVRELLLGPKRYTDLARGLPGSSPTVLSQRLRDLEAAGLVDHAPAGPPVGGHLYALTPRGRDLEDVLLALGRWGSRAQQTSKPLCSSSNCRSRAIERSSSAMSILVSGFMSLVRFRFAF